MVTQRFVIVVAIVAHTALAVTGAAVAQGPLIGKFSYQGRLLDGGTPVDGTADITVRLYDSSIGGLTVSIPVSFDDWPVNDGLFTIAPNFGGNVLDGDQRWMEVTVNGVTLSPRQEVVAAPYALQTRGMFYNETEDFLGVGRENRVTFNEVFGLYRPGSDFGGMYVETDAGGSPFYGYATGNTVRAYHHYDDVGDAWRLQVGFVEALTATETGRIGIGETSPDYPLHVEGTASFLVFGRNDQTSGSSITGFADGTFGFAINGVANGDSSRAIRGIANGAGAWAGYFEGDAYVRDFLGIGTTAPRTALHVRDNLNGTASVDNHVAVIENTSTGTSPDVLAIKINSTDLTPGSAINFISFFNDAEDNLGSIQGNGLGSIELAGAGNDYAEWLPHAEPGETFRPGDVVGVFGSRISKRTEGAQQLMVISTQPIVVGNRPRDDDDGLPGWEKVAFIGQAPVRVRGPVSAGDFLVSSGAHDGTAVAVAPEAITSARLPMVIATAWEAAFSDGVTLVNAAVGIDQAAAAARVIDAMRATQQRQQVQVDALREEVAELASMLRGAAPRGGGAR